MKSQTLKIVLLLLVSCADWSKGKTFISCDISITHKFYFISGENYIDIGRPMSLVCSNVDSVYTFSRFQTVGFDSSDYLALDAPISIHNRIDSAIQLLDKPLDSICDRPICVQLKSEFKIISKTRLVMNEINADKRLSSVHSTCEHMDEGLLYELMTDDGEKYSIYDLMLFESCECFQRDILLFKQSTLINEQHF
jgi:hypothetical protein